MSLKAAASRPSSSPESISIRRPKSPWATRTAPSWRPLIPLVICRATTSEMQTPTAPNTAVAPTMTCRRSPSSQRAASPRVEEKSCSNRVSCARIASISSRRWSSLAAVTWPEEISSCTTRPIRRSSCSLAIPLGPDADGLVDVGDVAEPPEQRDDLAVIGRVSGLRAGPADDGEIPVRLFQLEAHRSRSPRGTRRCISYAP